MNIATVKMIPRKIHHTFVIIFLVSVWLPAIGRANPPEVIYQIKASYVYNFLQFVNFPSETLQNPDQIRVCLVGEDHFGSALDEIDNATAPQGRIRVLRLGRYYPNMLLDRCNVLYLAVSEARLASKILAQIDSLNVLTIGEFNAFIAEGGLIELYQANDSIRFRINGSLVKETHFKIAAQLVQLGVE